MEITITQVHTRFDLRPTVLAPIKPPKLKNKFLRQP